jgi:hypothetical protein
MNGNGHVQVFNKQSPADQERLLHALRQATARRREAPIAAERSLHALGHATVALRCLGRGESGDPRRPAACRRRTTAPAAEGRLMCDLCRSHPQFARAIRRLDETQRARLARLVSSAADLSEDEADEQVAHCRAEIFVQTAVDFGLLVPLAPVGNEPPQFMLTERAHRLGRERFSRAMHFLLRSRDPFLLLLEVTL